MQRREFITLLGGAAATWPLAARAQRAPMPAIGFLESKSARDSRQTVAAFHRGLNEAAFSEGQNVAIHRITIIDERGTTAAVMEACFSFGDKAAFHLIGLYVSEHDYHGRDDEAGVLAIEASYFVEAILRGVRKSRQRAVDPAITARKRLANWAESFGN